ncbi:hypothetical protein L249_1418 [Ophiocordyceps polyrhachis-furcata BCC 54312]|uniref:WSC domain-containing protein n=1 Tax=Ophiocordyceps polyrhachis-furcata BCC 54312 TaxID=1330021 RepID=A0A367L4H7_9HYPO|nr:hypothetical protein L249_1418 [Ophiocordyceps polyrhachis-furcata BCC 54312]
MKLLLLSGLVGSVRALASTDTITWGGDDSRAGYQPNHKMDPAVVASPQFGQLFSTLLPGSFAGQPEQIYSQPLVYTPSAGGRQFVYVATTLNNVYKLDAKSGAILASRNLHLPFLTADLDGCVDINPAIGVTSTGTIDPTTDTLYLTSKTYVDQTAGDRPQGRPAGRYYVHALDVNDLTERPNFPVSLQGILARNNPSRMFTGGIHLQRPALLLAGQYLYAGFASHCVQYNFTGWILGLDKSTGSIVERWATEGAGVPETIRGGGIWMSGGGLSSDGAGSVFLATGNGYASQLSTIPVRGYNPPTSLEEAALHLTINANGSLNLVDFFMPWEKQAMDGADKDLGTSPLEILPAEFSCGDVKRIGVVTAKTGKTYWLNLDNMGGYRNGRDGLDDIIQSYQNENSVYSGAGVYPLEGGYVYINVIQYPTAVFKFSCNGGIPAFTKVAVSPTSNAYILGVGHGTVTSMGDELGTALLWVTDVQGAGVRVYNAVPKDGSLVSVNSFNVPGITKFSRAVFGDAIMYVGTTTGYIYGFGSPVNSPLNCTSPLDFGTVDLQGTSDAKLMSCRAVIDLVVTGLGLADGRDFVLSDSPMLPLQLSQGQTFAVNAKFKPVSVGLLSADLVVNTTNGVTGFSTYTHARLVGNGRSAGPLLALSPNTVSFPGVITGQDPNDVSETMVVANRGNAPLTIKSILYSADNSTSPQPYDGQGDLKVGRFTLRMIPKTVAANTGSAVNVFFNSSVSGTFSASIKFVTDGGNGTVTIYASSGPAPIALLEFQTADGLGWVEYTPGAPFSFGNVTENTWRSLKFRITNAAPTGGVKLSLTVSKPPFGVSGLVKAVNQVDLAEGSSLAPGQNATAVLTCAAPKSQWNVDSYNGTSQWTLNTNDAKLGKQFVQFACNAVAEQAPPLLPGGKGRYRYVGCFKDNTPERQLPDQVVADDGLTNAMCIAACAKGNYVFCGTEYLRECWAGNQIPMQKADEENCNYNCAGSINQICGGNGVNDGAGGAYMSLFADSLRWDGNSTRPPPAAGPVVNPGVAGFVSVGCYTEGNPGRALPNGVGTGKRTVAACVGGCKAATFSMAGVEYGGECWCGNALGAGSVSAPAADCGMACNAWRATPGHFFLEQLFVIEPPSGGQFSFDKRFIFYKSFSLVIWYWPGRVVILDHDIGDIHDDSQKLCHTDANRTVRQDGGRTVPFPRMLDGSDQRQGPERKLYFAAEYGRECYCGDSVRDGSVRAVDQRDCSANGSRRPVSSLRKKEGDISDSFVSLSGTQRAALPDRFRQLKCDLVRGKEDRFVDGWSRLLRRLKRENELIGRRGSAIVPQVDFDDLEGGCEMVKDEVRKRGVVVVRGVVPEEEARGYKFEMDEYIARNPHTREGQAFPAHDPQVYELYWSGPQLKARAHPSLLKVQRQLMGHFWHATDEAEISLANPLTYADRLRIRKPGDASFALGPHMDGGSVERWEPEGYGRGGVYDRMLSGEWESHDPWDAGGRVKAVNNLYDGLGACSMFRAWQGWLAMSACGPRQGTLLVNPLMSLATAYVLMRPFFKHVGRRSGRSLDEGNWLFTGGGEMTSELQGAVPGFGQEVSDELHPHLELERTMVHVPAVKAGDFVAWHCDTIHSVDKVHAGTSDSSVLYIPVCPTTVLNGEYLVRQRAAFRDGTPAPDFPGGEGEARHVGRPSEEDVFCRPWSTAEGRRAFGLEKLGLRLGAGVGEREVVGRVNALLGL